ncbi:multiple sugar transport system substrate-binding protein [Microbacterium sp. SORGH_AS 1204]|uniref:ABC transporter substrate-binding protein n=1 Tax=Microbacterium sp. SORGH_AS_1204 TaxID=3041785 RepID=UPI00279262D2|nr:extracellular solute-binding protein [Microbacterium sp. SORGH_AS_1204]MDQ1135431.1 multiple sugar transport system substrate-binding protein [Microbacterium sp. SORGH_AS_1204]
MPQQFPGVPRRLALAGGLAVVTALALSACSPGTSGGGESSSALGFTAVEQDASSAITVWVDSSREPIANAFKEANPDITVNVETYDGGSGGSGSFQQKVALFDQAGEGWPDVVFSSQQNDTAWAAKENNGVQAFAAPLNKGYFDQSFLDGFTDGALSPMTVDDTVYGVRNDLAPVVFWYNQALFDQFGYSVPTTWEEYKDLSDKLAAEHPGFILGSVGDSFQAPYVYYWGGEAPIFQAEGTTFSSNFTDPNSEKVTDLIDHMLGNGTLVTDSVFGTDFVTKYKDKLLGIPGPAWYSGALFENPESLNYSAGTVGVGAPLTWSDGDKVTGNVGGGVWYASSHSKNLDASKKFLEFVTSSDQAVELAAGLPAYQSTADAWLKEQAASGFYVGDFEGALSTAASSVWQDWGYPSFSIEAAYSKVVLPIITAGDTVASAADAWKTEMDNQAQVQGYTIGQ